MSRRRLFVPPERLVGPSLLVTGGDHRYLARVLRVRPGQEVTLFDGAGGEVRARVGRVGPAETELLVGERLSSATSERASPIVPVVLLAAVPRGGRMDILVQKTSELGVARIVPVLTARSVARPDAGRQARWQKIAREAARQCGRADVPAVDPPVDLPVALAADLPRLRLALYEHEHGRALATALDDPQPTAILVGPEGGFAEAEMQTASAAGFLPVGLGRRILRAETAAIVALALVQQAYGELG